MAPVVLGLDIGGANLKAATADRRATSVPFPLWKQPDRLPAALAELVARFPDAEEFAVTMTGELCDCFATKRDGVNAILTAVQNVSRSYPIRVWGTDGTFLNVEEARRDHLKVASANWHALATLAGGYVPDGPAILLDIGSTTTDIIPLLDGVPVPVGRTDPSRLEHLELLYVGVRRTPLCAILGPSGAAELFATTHDVYLLLGWMPEEPDNMTTADGRAATRAGAHARISRMYCSDPELMSAEVASDRAAYIHSRLMDSLLYSFRAVVGRLANHQGVDPMDRLVPVLAGVGRPKRPPLLRVITAGEGEFAAQMLMRGEDNYWFGKPEALSLNEKLGPAVSACAPAYAVAVLATERRA